MTSLISVSDGWWTFANYATLTTTYTPAPSCTATERLGLGYVNHGYVNLEYGVQCTSEVKFEDCLPTTTATATSYPDPPTGDRWAGIGGYYSPGLYCPSGWETIGVAARDASSSLTLSGILSAMPTVTITSSDPLSYFYATVTWDDPATILRDNLEPKQTMAVCCPSSFTPDPFSGCYSIVSDYKLSWGCQSYTGHNYEYGEVTETYTHRTYTETYVGEEPTTTIFTTETDTHTFNRLEKSTYSAISYMPMITLLHHESDLVSASSASATGSKAGNATGTTAATTSNAAVRLVGRRDGWSGIGAVAGIVMVAMGLGAAIVLQ